MSAHKLLYKTLSVCPTCSLLEGKGIEHIPAVVETHENKVWLVAEYVFSFVVINAL